MYKSGEEISVGVAIVMTLKINWNTHQDMKYILSEIEKEKERERKEEEQAKKDFKLSREQV